ncbi:MarR family winged helix-turn-helix transcriptional regulator [Kitasatospora sp. NPDC051853]|uniref:MarR family winged helix-turn-helix transcriptional regulator n=1 Tax=Kitasatospora sp. NPDC051853 TaxID=3364058 RepID=UPI0037967619
MSEHAPAPDSRAFALQLQALAAEMNLLSHDFAAEQGLHTTDVQALLAVVRAATAEGDAGMTPGRLRTELALTSGAVSACLDRLERAGHVERTRDEADGRQVRVRHRPGAARLAGSWFRPVAERTELVRSEFGPEEQAVVSRFLARITEELEELRTERRAPGTP